VLRVKTAVSLAQAKFVEVMRNVAACGIAATLYKSDKGPGVDNGGAVVYVALVIRLAYSEFADLKPRCHGGVANSSQ
jgi:hypothetical protein